MINFKLTSKYLPLYNVYSQIQNKSIAYFRILDDFKRIYLIAGFLCIQVKLLHLQQLESFVSRLFYLIRENFIKNGLIRVAGSQADGSLCKLLLILYLYFPRTFLLSLPSILFFLVLYLRWCGKVFQANFRKVRRKRAKGKYASFFRKVLIMSLIRCITGHQLKEARKRHDQHDLSISDRTVPYATTTIATCLSGVILLELTTKL